MFSIIELRGTTNSSGAKVCVASRAVNGWLVALHEDKGTLADGVDLTVAVVNSKFTKTILTLTDANTDGQEWLPRVSSCGATGTSNSDYSQMEPIVGKLQCTIAQGGDTKTGGLYAVVLE